MAKVECWIFVDLSFYWSLHGSREKSVHTLKAKQIVAICMRLTGSSEIPRMNLSFDCNNFVAAEIVYGPSRFKKVIFVLLDLMAVIGE